MLLEHPMVMPIFPLGSVLLPGMVLPLHVFEPRYLQMLADILTDDDPMFGVVLIERGNEVGGGDTRTDTGTVAHVLDHRSTAGGRHSLMTIGVERIRVDQWLPDDPYPLARVASWPDETPDSNDPVADEPPTNEPGAREPASSGIPTTVADAYASCTAELRVLLHDAAQRGHRVAPADFQVPDDIVMGSFMLSQLLPVGSFDRQRLLEAPGAALRIRMIAGLLAEQRQLLEGGY